MAILMGPVLSFRGYDPATQQWNLNALVVADAAPGDLSVTGQPGTSKPEILWKNGKPAAYRYTFSLTLQAVPSSATYKVAGKSNQIALPPVNASPTMAYASCNGFSSLKLKKSTKDANAVWKKMAAQHAKKPYHLLLLGGDQVYADEMWEIDGPMKEWADRPWDDGNAAPAPPAMRKWLDDYFFNLYTDRWAQPEVAAMFASIPTVAMWDDHDLTDGWGSYPKERQTSAVYGALWTSACKAFAVFQQHLADDETRPGAIGGRPGKDFPVVKGAFSFGYVVDSVAILAVDMRSQRTAESQVVGADHWNEVYAWIDALPKTVGHLIFMSSIPVVYPGLDILEAALGIIPGHQDLEDDVRDHWDSPPHKGEQLRLVRRLLGLPREMRATLVSGDVHVACYGVVESKREQDPQSTINQMISSGVVHPGPGAVVLWGLTHLLDKDRELEHNVVARMLAMPNTLNKFIGSRNYLSLEPDDPDPKRPKPRIWANWFFEDTDHPVTKVIEPNP